MTSVLVIPKISDPRHPFSTTYGTPPKRVSVTVRNPAFHAAFGSRADLGGPGPLAPFCPSRNRCIVPRLICSASAISRMDLPSRWRFSALSRSKSSLRRPSCLPGCLAFVRPATTRSRIISRSNSDTAARMYSSSLLVGFDSSVSIDWVVAMKRTPADASLFRLSTRLSTERPNRSSFHTATYPANPSLFFSFAFWSQFFEAGADADEPAQKQAERLILRGVVLTEQIQQPGGGSQMLQNGGRIGGGPGGGAGRERRPEQMPGVLLGQMKLAL